MTSPRRWRRWPRQTDNRSSSRERTAMNAPTVAPNVTALPGVAPAALAEPVYKRILLKLSGEALMGEDAYGINRQVIDRIVAEIGEVVRLGVEIAVVIGGGNIFRGVAPGA